MFYGTCWCVYVIIMLPKTIKKMITCQKKKPTSLLKCA